MNAPPIAPKKAGFPGFRAKLLVAMMLIVATITALAAYIAERSVAANVAHTLRLEFQAGLAALHRAQVVRQDALVERCSTLVKKPRIHAALEDGALDLLYPSARDELKDVMVADGGPQIDPPAHGLRAQFFRFLDRKGAVISPPNARGVGLLSEEEERQLALPSVPERVQIGYLARSTGRTAGSISEVITMPISSSETGEAIAAIVLGFKPLELGREREASEIQSGIWLGGRLHLFDLEPSARQELEQEIARALSRPISGLTSLEVKIEGTPHLLFYKLLNADSLFPPAFEISVSSLTDLFERQRTLRWRVLSAGTALLVLGLVASHVLAGRLSEPVEKLAADSADNRMKRERAEAALESTSEELQRSARFSADASHQLKTPVTVLRAGLEELLARHDLTPEQYNELSALVHQTYRLSSVIEDLLLLSRMEAGRLKIEFSPVNLTRLIEGWLDDLGALPDPLNLKVETDIPAALYVAGEKRYTTLILQNLLENARKYNRSGGRIHIAAHQDGDSVLLTIGNTGRPIPAHMQQNVFERFHRGAIGENVPGQGLGLNLARELARIHKGDLWLARSDEEMTEFTVRFCVAQAPATGAKGA